MRLLLPAFLPSSPSLSFFPFSPFSHFTHLQQRDYEVSSSTVTATSLPGANPSKPQYSNSGVVPGHQPTCLWNSICMESTTKEGAPVAEGLPEEANGIGDSRAKNDRDRNTCVTGNCLRVQISRVVNSRQNLDANQSNWSCIRSSTRIPRITCACTRPSRGI